MTKSLTLSIIVLAFFSIAPPVYAQNQIDPCSTDFTGPNNQPDGITNIYDYLGLVTYFLQPVTSLNQIYDANHDNKIDITDFSYLVLNFLKPCTTQASPTPPPNENSVTYPLHTNITSTTFWAGEPKGNGSSEDNALTAYDDAWLQHYGGFDEYRVRRTAANNYFPPDFYPKENPFYLDLPYDDLNVATNFNNRTNIIPWAKGQNDPGKSFSFMKNRWVKIIKGNRTCYGQIQDAGPYVYNDANYVFGSNDARPKSTRANNAGMDVSPALRDCLGFADINGDSDKVDWQFVEFSDVPDGPWRIVITTSGVYQP